VRLIKFLSSESLAQFGLAIAASILSGILTMSVLILLLRVVGVDPNVKMWDFVGVAAAAIACRRLAQRLLGRLSRRSLMRTRINLATQIVSVPLVKIEEFGSSKLIASFTGDIGRIAGVIPNLVHLCANVSFSVACLAYLWWLSPERGVVILILIAVGLILHYLFQRKGRNYVRASRLKRDDLFHAFRVLIDAAKELRLNSLRRSEALAVFQGSAADLEHAIGDQGAFFEGAAIATQVLFFVALGLATFVIRGDAAHQPVIVASYAVCIVYLMRPLRNLIDVARDLRAASVALERVEQLGFKLQNGHAENAPQTPADCAVRAPQWNELELDGVVYEYEADAEGKAKNRVFTLGPVDLKLNPAQIVFIVGGNGTGKTTLAKLIAGLYAPTAGEIRIDSCRIEEENRDLYRQCFSAVFTDSFLFSRLPVPGAQDNDARATELLERLNLEKKLSVVRGVLSTSTGLSAGERKRLALACALLEDRPIYLFDEWAAEQETRFKESFYMEVLPQLRDKGKLVLVISHDSRYFHVADQIISLDHGVPTIIPRDSAFEGRSTGQTAIAVEAVGAN
jgi:putative pyoverdin transport system ATP-binding/permease protein